MLREVNLQLVGFAGIEGACRSGYLNHPPVQLSRENYAIRQVVQIHLPPRITTEDQGKPLEIKNKDQQKRRVLERLDPSILKF
jgi:hypothetical protein